MDDTLMIVNVCLLELYPWYIRVDIKCFTEFKSTVDKVTLQHLAFFPDETVTMVETGLNWEIVNLNPVMELPMAQRSCISLWSSICDQCVRLPSRSSGRHTGHRNVWGKVSLSFWVTDSKPFSNWWSNSLIYHAANSRLCLLHTASIRLCHMSTAPWRIVAVLNRSRLRPVCTAIHLVMDHVRAVTMLTSTMTGEEWVRNSGISGSELVSTPWNKFIMIFLFQNDFPLAVSTPKNVY